MDAIDRALQAVSGAGDVAMDVLQRIDEDVADVFRRFDNELKSALTALDDADARLRAEVDAHPEHFVKPRSRLFAGVRVERRKQRDDWKFDPTATAALIRNHRADLAHAISTVTKIDTSVLDGLPARTLKLLGVTRKRRHDATNVKRLRDDLADRLERVRPWL